MRSWNMPLAEDLKQLTEHDLQRARTLLHQIVEQVPRSAEARILLGHTYLRSLECEAALDHYRAASEIDANAAEAVEKTGLCLVALGRYEEALAAFEQLFKLRQSAMAMTMEGVLLHRLGRVPEAIARYRLLLDSCKPDSPEIPHALQGLVLALRDAGRPLEADEAAGMLLRHAEKKPLQTAYDLAVRNNSIDFHEWSHYADKARLAAALARHAGSGASAVLFPPSFVLPEERAALKAYAAGQGRGAVFIVKPRHGSGGQGIALTERVAEAMDRADVVVQRYVEDPYLVDGKKAHLRIYGLIASVAPLRAYVYEDGIVRFAPERYQRGSGWLGRVGMHVTNTALHRGHPDLAVSDDPNQENVGNVWSLAAYLRRIAEDGRDPQQIFGAIAQLAAGFVRLLQAEGLFARQSKQGPPRGFVPKLFGLDVLLDKAARPWLIEMQRAPAPGGSALVNRINGTLFATILRMSMGRLVEDGMHPDRIAAILGDAHALRAREAEIESAQRGRFVPLDLV